MRNSFLVLLTLTFVFGYVSMTSATFIVRSGSCNGGETCILSMWNLSDSHVGMCGYYTNYSLCTSEVASAVLRNAPCNAGEGGMISFYQQNNSHIELYKNGTYGNNVCVPNSKYYCQLRSSCIPGESSSVSVNNYTNSHIGDVGYYPKTLCCGNDTTSPAIANEAVNSTEISSSEPVRLTANVTDSQTPISNVLATINYPSGTNANFTMNILSGSIYYYDFADTSSNGTYTWTYTYANDSVDNWAQKTTSLTFATKGFCQTISGKALDYFTGLPISSGTATAIIKENGDRKTVAFSNGQYNFTFCSYIDTSRNSITIGIVVNSTDKVGWSSTVIGGGPFTKQIQQCSTRQLRFAGNAIVTTGNRSEERRVG